MNFPVQQLYAVDHSYQIHNSNPFDYTLPLNGKDDQSAYQMTNNFQTPVHQTNESSQVFPIFDPYCPTAYMSQIPQPYNNQLCTIPNSISGNNSMNYHQLSNYSTNENRIDNGRYFMGYHPDYYRSPVLNIHQLVPSSVIATGPKATNFQLSSNQISILNNNIQINNSIDNSTDNYITNNIKSIQTTTTTTTNEIIQKRFVQQCLPRKSFKSTRNKSKSIMPVKTAAVFPNNHKSSSIHFKDQQQITSIATPNCDQRQESQSVSQCQFIDLMITNLDYNISGKEWKKLLLNQFQNAIKRVHSVLIQAQPDGSNCGIVRVNTIEDARLAISQFHRKKIGYKRIQVNILMNAANDNAPSVNIKQEVAALLKSVAGYSLSVYKFMELYEKRYHRNIAISDFYKMKDFVEIKDVGGNQNWKIISLTNNAINSYKRLTDTSDASVHLESMVCDMHCKEGTEDYITALESAVLPNVEISLKLLKDQVHKMLQSHNGTIQLMSFLCCYKAEFNDIQIIKSSTVPCNSIPPSLDHQELEILTNVTDINESISTSNKLPESSSSFHLNKDICRFDGVPLEHLLTCISGIKLVTTTGGVKQIQWEEKKDGMDQPTQDQMSDSSSSYNRSVNGIGGILIDRLHQFSREVVDLLKHQPNCKMFLGKFIPTYHHHFGKQCRVADYGFSKLHELLEALPQVVHVVGTGYMRMLYLGHKVQVRRFTNEMIKVLKSKATKTCRLSDYPSLYKMLFHKDFYISDYGVCFMEDLLDLIPESTVEIIHSDDIYIAMPKRIQTSEEKERTFQFAIEVIDLLKQSPRCRLPFNKFIPSYHHHFSKQCKVAEYGFTKLIELLDAVPNVIQVVEEHGEKFVILTPFEMLRVFAEQTLNILEKSFNNRIQLSEFPGFYLKTAGHTLILEDYVENSLMQLIEKIPRIAKLQNYCIVSSPNKSKNYNSDTKEDESLNEQNEIFICLADRNHVKYLAHKVLLVLLEVPSGSMPDYQFVAKYHYKYREDPNLALIQTEMSEVIQIINDSSLLPYPGSSGFYIRLKPFILFARDLKDLMRFHQCKIPLMQLENLYEQHFGLRLQCQSYGFPTIFSLIQACDFVVTLKGRGMRASLILYQDFVGKLAYSIAYDTRAISQIIDNNKDIDSQHSDTPILTNPSKPDDNEKQFTSLVSKNTPMSSFMNLPRPNCPLQSVYNHNIYPSNNFLSTLNTYPSYFNHQPLYNPWFRQWYQPDQSYGYTPNLYSHPEFGVVSIAQSPMSNMPCATACQDQKQIDELVETLAYDNSCSSALTPPPATFQQIYHTIEANNPIINSPWVIYPSYQFLQSNPLVSGYNATVSNGDNEPVEHPMERLLNETPEHLCTNNNNQCAIIEKSFRKIEFTKKFIFSKNMSDALKTIT